MSAYRREHAQHRLPGQGLRQVMAAAAAAEALRQVGKPYQWAAAGPNSFDCSGLTLSALAGRGRFTAPLHRRPVRTTTHISMPDRSQATLCTPRHGTYGDVHRERQHGRSPPHGRKCPWFSVRTWCSPALRVEPRMGFRRIRADTNVGRTRDMRWTMRLCRIFTSTRPNFPATGLRKAANDEDASRVVIDVLWPMACGSSRSWDIHHTDVMGRRRYAPLLGPAAPLECSRDCDVAGQADVPAAEMDRGRCDHRCDADRMVLRPRADRTRNRRARRSNGEWLRGHGFAGTVSWRSRGGTPTTSPQRGPPPTFSSPDGRSAAAIGIRSPTDGNEPQPPRPGQPLQQHATQPLQPAFRRRPTSRRPGCRFAGASCSAG